MKGKIETIEMLKRLIEIPSWVGEGQNESQIGEYIFSSLKDNTNLKIEKQRVEGDRFNVIAWKGDEVDNLIVGHIDTVQPSNSWTIDPLKVKVDGDRLYGLGSTDMKSGVAVMMSLATDPDLPTGTMFLFYVDEEYDFVGMKSFVEEFSGKIKPRRIISLDGKELRVGNGCRGLIEISCVVKGKAAHAASPQNGANAIVKSYEILTDLFKWLDKYVDDELGPTTVNVAYINGGQYKGETGEGLILGKQGNVIADVCQFILDIRPASNELSAEKIIDYIKKQAVEKGVFLVGSSIRHNYGSWLTKSSELGNMELPLGTPSQVGYIDVQMLWESFGKVPCFTIGAAEQSMGHSPDEYVMISKVNELEEILRTITRL